MHYERQLLFKALTGDAAERALAVDEIIEHGVNRSFFYMNPEYWDFAIDHKKNYRVYPDIDTFKAQFQLADSPTPEPLRFYIDGIAKYRRFKIMSTAMDEADKLFAVGQVDKGIERIFGTRRDIESTIKSRDLSIKDSVDERKKLYEDRYLNPGVNGIPTGFPSVDNITYGWQKDEFSVIMAMLGSYKSWLLLYLAAAAIRAGKKPLVATVEMGKHQVARRLDAILTSTKFANIRSGKFDSSAEYSEFMQKMDSLKAISSDAIVVGGTAFGEMFLQSKIDQHKPDILLIDGLYLMSDDSMRFNKQKADWERLKDISMGIKLLAQNNSIPAVATTQMDVKKAEKKAGKEMISFMNYSMGIAQNADNVFSMGRIYDPVLEKYTPEVIFKGLKMREGEGVTTRAVIDFEGMTFTEQTDVLDTRTSEFVKQSEAAVSLLDTPGDSGDGDNLGF